MGEVVDSGIMQARRSVLAPRRIALFANTDWYLFNFRRSLIERLAECGCDPLLITPPGDYGLQLKAMGYRWTPLRLERRSLNPASELRSLYDLTALVAAERAELVHGFTIKSAVYGAWAARLAGAPARVSSITGLGYVFTSPDLKARALRPAVRAAMKSALDGPRARLIVQNSDDLAFFRDNGLCQADHLRLIRGSGVDLSRFRPSTRSRSGPFTVVLAARLLWDKGLADYVDAARRLKAAGAEIRFLLAGGPDNDNPATVPAEIVRQWANEGAIEWLGHVDDMAALFATVDAVALPSRREGLPKSLIEGAAAGLPLVTVDAPGCREVVRHGIDGFVLPVGDVDALANAFLQLAGDSDLARRMGRAARQRAGEFDETLVVDATIDVYNEILEPPLASVMDAPRRRVASQ